MSDEDRDSASFDPRSWLGQPSSATTRPLGGRVQIADVVDEGDSFDPSTWGKTATPTPPIATPPPPPMAEVPARPRRSIIAPAAALAVLAASLTTAYLTREEQAAAPVPAAATSTAATPVAPGQSRRSVNIAGPEQMLATLVDLGLPTEEATALANQALAALGNEAGELRVVVDLTSSEGGAVGVSVLEATRANGSGVRLTAGADRQFATDVLEASLTTQVLSASGEMDTTSFYSSAVAAGINDSLISDFAKAFSFDVNFQTEVVAGDVFEAAFEQDVNPAGEAVGTPRLLFVSLRTRDKSLRYYRFTPPGEKEASWFDANGRGNTRALMRTPVDGARITSNFGPRFHPVLHYTRLHGGTDFAAPVGTPIYAAAAGTVVSASPSACAGNMVILRHDNGWETRYFHASRYADGIVAGARVTQGQTIADVGNTGKCTTGPHLHYEVHISGEKVDPMSIDTSTSVALEGAAMAAFKQQREKVDAARAGQSQ